MAKDKFLRFQNQRKEYLRRFSHPMYRGFEKHEDLVLKELLEQIEVDVFYSNNLIMRKFKHRFANFVPWVK